VIANQAPKMTFALATIIPYCQTINAQLISCALVDPGVLYATVQLPIGEIYVRDKSNHENGRETEFKDLAAYLAGIR
jgi:hypothetical protein